MIEAHKSVPEHRNKTRIFGIPHEKGNKKLDGFFRAVQMLKNWAVCVVQILGGMHYMCCQFLSILPS